LPVHVDVKRLGRVPGGEHRQLRCEAVAFFAAQGVRVERVMTDNDWTYAHAREVARLLGKLGIRYVRTWPRRPPTNGKAERFIGTLQRQ
jgi:transposase InsO family protein